MTKTNNKVGGSSNLTTMTNDLERLKLWDFSDLDSWENEAPVPLERRGNVGDGVADVSGRRLSPQQATLEPLDGEPPEPKPTKCQRAADDLRLLADWFEAHPDVELPVRLNPDWEDTFYCFLSEDKTRMREQLRAIGSFEKAVLGTDFVAKVKVGHFKLEFLTKRENVCTRTVVGTKEVPAEVIPSKYVPEKVIPAHTEEVAEWVCGSVLAPAEGEEEPSEG
jgi:hypothetical protein